MFENNKMYFECIACKTIYHVTFTYTIFRLVCLHLVKIHRKLFEGYYYKYTS